MTDRLLWMAIGMAVLSGVTWAALGRGFEVLLGVAAPVLTTAASWVSVTRAWAAAPDTSLAVLIRGFAVKSVFFVAWVTIVLKGCEVRPMPFVASLTVSFLVLHLIEAWCLKRLMQTYSDD
ncbi:MAG: hypothetical protein FJW21_02105 [Acidimicrobiia bacterium]|nr:hypothetical protein [Acidimicrobiia bacterium]